MQQLTAGDVLAGRFRLIELVGRGGTGEVWAAHDATLKIDVAVKILPAGSSALATDFSARLMAEGRRLRGLVHPGILRIFAVVADGTNGYVAMELARGGELGQLRGAGFRDIVAAALEVLDALQYAHAQGVVHGDIKAGNILLDASGHWRLADFRLPNPAGPVPVSLSTVSPQQLAGAEPTVADDVFALGALLYDLLAGHPPLHPGITAERIASEVPARLGVDGRGQAVPPALAQLVATMLDKVPARRPASLGGVRAVLQEALEDERVPLAGAGQSQVEQPGRGLAGGPARRVSTAERRGEKVLPAWVVYGGAGLLVAGLVGVMFLLPRMIRERPLPTAATPAPVAAPAPSAAAAGTATPTPDAQAAAGEALARFVRSDDAAKKAGADRWGGADWLEARRLADMADAQYRAADFAVAATSYAAAADRLQALADGAAGQFAAALRDGSAALANGDRVVAMRSFERALLIKPNDPVATRGLARSQKLDEVLRLMAEASGNESAGDLTAARRGFQAALAVDGEWAPARAGLARIDTALATSAFERDMARGLAALAAGRTAEARAAIESAQRARPGDPGAKSALEQLNGDERRGRIISLQAEADGFAAAEKWPEAVARYEGVLAIDPTLVTATSGLQNAQARAQLNQRLEGELARADRFNDDAIAGQARAVVAEATAVPDQGPIISEQVRRLKESLATAAVPVAVRFESDNQTNVVIFKIGTLGLFMNRTVELRPGPYVVVGTRDGYRDVRRNVRVDTSGNMPPVVVRCEEPI